MAAPNVYEALFPEKADTGPAYPDSDGEHVHRELAREGVTLRRPHAVNCDALIARGEPSMSCNRFCELSREFAVCAGREPRRPQGRQHHGGRLGRVDDGALGPGHGRDLESVPVRRLPALHPPVLRRAGAGHEVGYLAAPPCARVPLLRRPIPCIVSDNLKAGALRVVATSSPFSKATKTGSPTPGRAMTAGSTRTGSATFAARAFTGRFAGMDLSVETRYRLRGMGASNLLDALSAQDEGM